MKLKLKNLKTDDHAETGCFVEVDEKYLYGKGTEKPKRFQFVPRTKEQTMAISQKKRFP